MAGLEPGLNSQYDQMQQDIDAMGGGNAAAAAGDGPILPPPGMQGQQPPDPTALMQNMMQNMMQTMMEAMMASFRQNVLGRFGVGGTTSSGVQSARRCPLEARPPHGERASRRTCIPSLGEIHEQ